MKDLPKHLFAYKRTPEFEENSIPKGLRRGHATKAGTWALIVVLEGRLLYRILEPAAEELILTPKISGVVEPTVRHEVEAIGEVRFYVEFYQ